MPTPEQLAEIRKRADAATLGPWSLNYYTAKGCDILVRSPGEKGFILAQTFGPQLGQAENDAEFIAHARQDIPALLDHIERLEMELAEARKQRDYEAEARARVNREMDALADKLKVSTEALERIAGQSEMTQLHDCCVDKSCTPVYFDSERVAHCLFQYGVNRGFRECASDASEALARIQSDTEKGNL